MSYKNWFDNHAKKHQNIINKLSGKTIDVIIEYFRFENMVLHEKDFCPLFAKNQKCHDIEELNCYFCGCPHFRFDDNAPKIKSFCSISSKDGKQMEYNGITHQDCSKCTVPHKETYIKKHFSYSWSEVMSDVSLGC
ncbi:MAG: hypothetical protein WHU93_04740 [Arcobacteraceae bacterium]